MKNLTAKSRKFLAQNPTKIGSVCGHDYYENPIYGDEAPLVVITPDGKKKTSCHWDMPTIHDISQGSI